MSEQLNGRATYNKSLFSCSSGSKVRITKVSIEKSLLFKLLNLGLRLNREISVIHRASNGNMVIAVGESRMAIDSQLTRRMLVQAI